MKKILYSVVALLAMSGSAAMAQDSTSGQFVSDFTNFVDYMAAHRSLDSRTMERADSIFNVYNTEYDNDYKGSMTNQQKEQYFEAKGRYEQLRLKSKAKDTADNVSDAGASLGQKVKKGSRHIMHKADSVGSRLLKKVKHGGKRAIEKADTLGHRGGRAVKSGYDESASYLRGLFGN